MTAGLFLDTRVHLNISELIWLCRTVTPDHNLFDFVDKGNGFTKFSFNGQLLNNSVNDYHIYKADLKLFEKFFNKFKYNIYATENVDLIDIGLDKTFTHPNIFFKKEFFGKNGIILNTHINNALDLFVPSVNMTSSSVTEVFSIKENKMILQNNDFLSDTNLVGEKKPQYIRHAFNFFDPTIFDLYIFESRNYELQNKIINNTKYKISFENLGSDMKNISDNFGNYKNIKINNNDLLFKIINNNPNTFNIKNSVTFNPVSNTFQVWIDSSYYEEITDKGVVSKYMRKRLTLLCFTDEDLIRNDIKLKKIEIKSN